MHRDEVITILTAHREELRRLGVKSLAIFGSVARDQARPDSDVDILVELDRPMGFFGFLDIEAYLERILGTKVDLGTPDSLKPPVRASALREAVHVV